jgi:hypothetical protein
MTESAEQMERKTREARTKFESVHAGRDDGIEALRLLLGGMSLRDVAQQIGVSVGQLECWNGEYVLMTLDYPPKLAEIRARSELRAPRRPETVQVFDGIVRDIFVPVLKVSGFKKSRNVWRRNGPRFRAVIDIQRAPADGDLLRFTSNWALELPGFDNGYGSEHVVGGRIGDFFGEGDDRWWSIQLGWLARDLPTISDDPEQCQEEIADGVARMVAWLDRIATVQDLIDAATAADGPLAVPGPTSLPKTIKALQSFTRRVP